MISSKIDQRRDAMPARALAPTPSTCDIVAEARSWIGTPYRHQASLRGAGCDCLGLLRGVWRALYGVEPETPPPYPPDWAEAGGRETLRDAALRHLYAMPLEKAEAGDVLLFRISANAPAKHCAILSNATHMIHAWSEHAVAEVPLGAYWRRRLVYAFRFPER